MATTHRQLWRRQIDALAVLATRCPESPPWRPWINPQESQQSHRSNAPMRIERSSATNPLAPDATVQDYYTTIGITYDYILRCHHALAFGGLFVTSHLPTYQENFAMNIVDCDAQQKGPCAGIHYWYDSSDSSLINGFRIGVKPKGDRSIRPDLRQIILCNSKIQT